MRSLLTDAPRGARVLWAAGLGWLPVGGLLLLLAGVELACPAWGCGLASFGVLVPAALGGLVFGWASQAGLAVALALLGARPGAAAGRVFPVALGMWNLGVILHVVVVLGGGMTWASPWLVGPAAAVLLLAGYPFLAWPGYVAFRRRPRPGLYASAWFALAALLSFPAILLTGAILLVWWPVAGPAQPMVAAWCEGGLLFLWLAPLAWGVCFHALPQATRAPLPAYNLTAIGFWSFIVLGGWAGLAPLAGGPAPLWLQSAGRMSSLLLLVPVGIFLVNLSAAWRAAPGWLKVSLASLAVSLSGLGLLPSGMETSDARPGLVLLFLLGGVTFALLGAGPIRGRGLAFGLAVSGLAILSGSLVLGGVTGAVAWGRAGAALAGAAYLVGVFGLAQGFLREIGEGRR